MPPIEGTPPEITPGTGDPAGTGGTPPAASVEGKSITEWVQSYKGLQGAYQKLKTQADTGLTELQAKLAEATQKVEELTAGGTSKDSQLGTLQTQLAALTNQVETLSGAKSKSDTDLSRVRLLLKEFPELAPWEAQELLPSGNTEDELRAKWTQFRSTLAGQVSTDLKKTMSGATPPGSGSTSPSTQATGDQASADFVWQKLVETAGRDQKAYSEWQAKWDAIQEALAAGK